MSNKPGFQRNLQRFYTNKCSDPNSSQRLVSLTPICTFIGCCGHFMFCLWFLGGFCDSVNFSVKARQDFMEDLDSVNLIQFDLIGNHLNREAFEIIIWNL